MSTEGANGGKEGFSLDGVAGVRDQSVRAAVTKTKRLVSEETRAKLRAAMVGARVSLETRAKMSAAKIGGSVSEATRIKISTKLKSNPRPWS